MANDYQGYSNTDWQRTATTTLAKHFKDEEKATLRNFQILALVESGGGVSYNNSGRGFDWPVKYRNHRVEGNNGETPRSFTRTPQHKVAHLEYRGYQVVDGYSNKEMKENRGPEAVINFVDKMGESLLESMRQGLGGAPFVDGEAVGNTLGWHGLESIYALNGTVKNDDGTQRAANAADYVGYPNDTYAGLNTGLGYYSGEQESGSVWPFGMADASFDFWSPIVVNAKSTAFAPPTHTWAGQAMDVLRFAIIHGQRNAGLDGQITNCIMDRGWYNDFINLYSPKEQINVQRNGDEGLVALGFKNVVRFDGIEISWDVGVPVNTAYGLNWRNINILSMDSQLFVPEGPFYDEVSQMHNWVLGTSSNMKLKSPRNFFKIANLT